LRIRACLSIYPYLFFSTTPLQNNREREKRQREREKRQRETKKKNENLQTKKIQSSGEEHKGDWCPRGPRPFCSVPRNHKIKKENKREGVVLVERQFSSFFSLFKTDHSLICSFSLSRARFPSIPPLNTPQTRPTQKETEYAKKARAQEK
jgi:hypothetical protein